MVNKYKYIFIKNKYKYIINRINDLCFKIGMENIFTQA